MGDSNSKPEIIAGNEIIKGEGSYICYTVEEESDIVHALPKKSGPFLNPFGPKVINNRVNCKSFYTEPVVTDDCNPVHNLESSTSQNESQENDASKEKVSILVARIKSYTKQLMEKEANGGFKPEGNNICHKGQDLFENISECDFYNDGEFDGEKFPKNPAHSKLVNYRSAMSERSGYAKKQIDGYTQCGSCCMPIRYFDINEYHSYEGCGHKLHRSCRENLAMIEFELFPQTRYLTCPLCSLIMLNSKSYEKVNKYVKEALLKN